MAAQTDDKKLDGAGLTTLWGIIKQYIADNPSIPKATASVLGGIMVGTTLAIDNSGVLDLASGIVTAGTYKSVTVDTYGRVTAGSNPNTLAGYGITDAKIDNGAIILGADSITPATQTWVQQQGYTSNIGTVIQVKVGTSAYDPSSGIVSLPAYPTTLPASDVYSWAKASSKPSYTASEVGAATSNHTHTTSIATSSGTNKITLAFGTKYAITAGGTSYVFTMPANPDTWRPLGTGATDACAGNDSRLSNSRPASDVYSWAKASSKPSYSWSEISSRPTKVSQFTNDSGYITGITKSMVTTALGYTPPTTDTNTWRTVQCNGTSIGNNTLNLKAGTNVSLSNSSGTITITSTDTNTWRGIQNNLTSSSTSDSLSANQGRLLANGSARDSTKLPLTGGTLTGNLTVNGNVKVANLHTLTSTAYGYFSLALNGNEMRLGISDYSILYVNYGAAESGYNCPTIYNFLTGNSNTYADFSVGGLTCRGFNNLSDMRLKNVIGKCDIPINIISNAPSFRYTWNNGQDANIHIGTSAQYWQKYVPDAVSEEHYKDGSTYLGLNYVSLAMASVISVAKETLTLKEKVALLETRVESLEKKIREYESN